MSKDYSEVEIRKALVNDNKLQDPQTTTSENAVQNRKNLIVDELKKVNSHIKVHNKEYKLYSRYDRISNFLEKSISATATIALLIGISQRSEGERVDNSIYYLATSANVLAFVTGQLLDVLNYQNRAHSAFLTWKALQNLHDFVAHTLASKMAKHRWIRCLRFS